MRNISYQGHARERKRGFDPIQVPDQTQKYAQEAERTLQHMREYQEQDLRNRTAVLDGLKENARIEENVRESNEDLRKTFDEAYQKAELQHYEQRLKDVQPGGGLYQDSKNKIAGIKKQQEDWKKLADLLPKAADVIDIIARNSWQIFRAASFHRSAPLKTITATLPPSKRCYIFRTRRVHRHSSPLIKC